MGLGNSFAVLVIAEMLGVKVGLGLVPPMGTEVGCLRRARLASATRKVDRFHQFNPVSEWVIDEKSPVPFEGLIGQSRVSSLSEPFRKTWQVIDDECRVCLPRRSEFLLDAQMHFQCAALEPATSAPCEVLRLAHLGNTQEARIERSRICLSSWRHCQ
jgi:hypothetical protein